MSARSDIIAASQRRCAEELLSFDALHRREVMSQLCFDRISQKQEFLVDKFHDSESWNETSYYMLLRGLDIKTNRATYERLAHILPYRILGKVTYDFRSVAALLLGCAGLLTPLARMCADDKDIKELQDTFEYESHKFILERLDVRDWQLVGIKGDNHPIVRLLQLADVLATHQYLMNDILECRTKGDVERFFCNRPLPKWARRFLSDMGRGGVMSRTKAHMLGINVVAQLQIFYSEYTMRRDLDSRGIELLEQLPAEDNLFVGRWNKLGIKAENSLESQALLQLSKEYCANLQCDKCPFRRFADAK